MDFRQPHYRREVFHRFYQFHLKYRAHPGAVYYVLPDLRARAGLTQEDMMTLCYINGVTQNIVTTWIIFSRFETLDALTSPAFAAWYRENYERLLFDTDRKWEKNKFERHLSAYRALVYGGSQVEFFAELAPNTGRPGFVERNFRKVWDRVMRDFTGFGRLATFSYTEYLRIAGLPIDCDSLFLDDFSGSRSHRNGLFLVLGRDDLLDDKTLNPGGSGAVASAKATLPWLQEEAELLLREAKERAVGAPFSHDVSYYTLESTLCAYKSWHKPNRRYPNVYNDMFNYRIRYAELKGFEKEIGFFWDIRKEALPQHLRLEDTPGDPGLKPEKQNHYRTTGQVIMMDQFDPVFKNDFNDRLNSYFEQGEPQ